MSRLQAAWRFSTSRDLSLVWRAFFSRRDLGRARTGGTMPAAWWGMAQLCLRHSRSRTHGSTCYEISAKIRQRKNPGTLPGVFVAIEEICQAAARVAPSASCASGHSLHHRQAPYRTARPRRELACACCRRTREQWRIQGQRCSRLQTYPVLLQVPRSAIKSNRGSRSGQGPDQVCETKTDNPVAVMSKVRLLESLLLVPLSVRSSPKLAM